MIILCIGWIVARIASSVVRRGLSRTTLDERLAGVLFGQERAQGTDLAGGIGRGVYYVIMLFVLVAFFQALGLTLITEPLNSLLNQVFAFIPQLIGAGVLLLVAWIIATIMRKIVAKGLATSNIDQRLGDEESGPVPISKSVAEAVYWLIFLLFLPAILGSLELGGLLAPVQGMLDKILGFLPNILTAGILLLIGWFVARLVQRIVTSLLAAVGLDRVSERVGLAPALGELQLSGILGMIVYIFILLPVVISALNALSLDAVAQPASDMLKQILSAIPAIFAAVLVVGVAYVIGRLVGGLIGNLLAGIGFDNILSKLGLGELGADKRQPSAIVGSLVMVVIIFFAAMEAFGMLGLYRRPGDALLLPGLRRSHSVRAGHSGHRTLPGQPGGPRCAGHRHGARCAAVYGLPRRHPGAGRGHGAAPDGARPRDRQPGLRPAAGRSGGGRSTGFRPGWPRSGGASAGAVEGEGAGGRVVNRRVGQIARPVR